MNICHGIARTLNAACLECEAPLADGGIPGLVGRVCSTQCSDNQAERLWAQHEQDHLHLRDLHCDCQICTAAGHVPGSPS